MDSFDFIKHAKIGDMVPIYTKIKIDVSLVKRTRPIKLFFS